MKYIFRVLLLLTIFSLSSSSLFAKSMDFQIFPAILEVESKPGESIEHQIILKGSSGEPYTLNVYGLNILDKYGRFASSMDEQLALDWISFEPKEFTFDLTLEKRVKIKINIPKEASLGDYYLTIALERVDSELGSSSLAGALEVPLLITVEDGTYPIMEARVKEFNTSFFNMFSPIKFKLEIENSGFRKIKSFGKVEIVNLLSKKKYTRELIPQNILSKSSRMVLDEYGFYTGNGLISWEPESLLGIYSAQAYIYDIYFEDPKANVLVKSDPIYFVYINRYLLITLIFILFFTLIFLSKRRLDSSEKGR